MTGRFVMPIQVIDISTNYQKNVTFVSPVYVDANFPISFFYSQHSKYSIVRDIWWELSSQNVEIHISTLTMDEFWHGLERVLKNAQGTASLLKNPAILTKIRADIQNATASILQLANVKSLPDSSVNPINTINLALDLYTQENLGPRDSFHLALAILSNASGFVTSDSHFDNINLPTTNLTIYKY
jgi:predicted nucleic acid-binding protein